MKLSEIDVNKLYLLQCKFTKNFYLKINNDIRYNLLRFRDMKVIHSFGDREFDIVCSLYDSIIENNLSHHEIFQEIKESERSILRWTPSVYSTTFFYVKIQPLGNNYNCLRLHSDINLSRAALDWNAEIVGSLNDATVVCF